jgi:hypothetical protein
MGRSRAFLSSISVFLFLTSVASAAPEMTLELDASDVARKILHARLGIPGEPGELTLL